MFSWSRFLNSNRIEYADTGPNTSRNNIVIHCPFCGAADKGHHMSINIDGKGWRCWRNHDHKGKAPTRLVQALLNVDWHRACEIVGRPSAPDNFIARVRAELGPAPQLEQRTLKLPKEFKPFTGLPSSRPFENYLINRGYDLTFIRTGLTDRYNVRYCTQGSFAGRVIFPVCHMGALISWTGRTIGSDPLRYKSLTVDAERAKTIGYKPAIGPISHYLLFHDRIINSNAETLILCEGPFDALKINVLGRKFGVVATCFFTAEPTAPQIDLLHDLVPRFRRCFIVLDKGEFAKSVKVAGKLITLGVEPKPIPNGCKDPAEFTSKILRDILRK